MKIQFNSNAGCNVGFRGGSVGFRVFRQYGNSHHVWENGETICTDVCVPGGAELFPCAGGMRDRGTDPRQQYWISSQGAAPGDPAHSSAFWRLDMSSRSLFALLALVALSGCDALKDDGVPFRAYRYAPRVPEAESVEECGNDCPVVVLDSVGLIGDSADAVLMMDAALLSTNGTIMSPTFFSEPGTPSIYRMDGSYSHTIGRWGGGPGEFVSSKPFPGTNGRLWLFDPGNTRITVVGDSGVIERSFRFHGVPYSLAPLDSTHFVISGLTEEDGVKRRSIHLYRDDGEYVRSFGPAYSKDYHGFPKIDVAPDGTIWLAHANQYRLEQWSREGELLRILDRDVSWFEPWHAAKWWKDTTLNWFQVDNRTGQLWVGMSLPDPDSPPPAAFTDRVVSVADRNIQRDSRIEVIDPETAGVVARATFDKGRLHPIHPTGLMHWPIQLDEGYVLFGMATRRITGRSAIVDKP